METAIENKFTQLCVWPATLCDENQVEDLVKFFKDEFNARIKFHSVQFTKPDMKDGVPVPDTGGRSDLFFYIHSDDIGHFAVPRLQVGIRWWEDVLGNGGSYLYTEEFLKENPRTW